MDIPWYVYLSRMMPLVLIQLAFLHVVAAHVRSHNMDETARTAHTTLHTAFSPIQLGY